MTPLVSPMRWYGRGGGGEHSEWWFSCHEGDRERLCGVSVTDTGRSFRWRVSLFEHGEWDAGYCRSLATAQAKAEQSYEACVDYTKDAK
jgi:hypothetical protein